MSKTPLDVKAIQKDFPILRKDVHGNRLVYLDNAATSQKPEAVLQTITDFYSNHNANVHRALHTLSQEATEAYEGTRSQVAKWINAKHDQEIIFTRGTTEAANLVMNAWAKFNISKGDTILVTRMEHHSNLVPWQALANEVGAELEILELNDRFEFDLDQLNKLLKKKPKLFAFSMMSNVLGITTPVKELSSLAKLSGAKVFIDAAQGAAHAPIDVQDWEHVDFVAFSAHKMCGPTGVGVLWGRKDLLEEMNPFQFGGDMIDDVGDKRATWNDLPWKFEAGTPNFEGVVAFGAALRYLEKLGMNKVFEHEKALIGYTLDRVQSNFPEMQILGPDEALENRGGVLSFQMKGFHPQDLASALDMQGIAVRTGHHCTMPLHRKFGCEGSCRASFYIYNDFDDADAFIEGLLKAKKMLG
jgi:cysteine desulfurase/selenocysteine lyase